MVCVRRFAVVAFGLPAVALAGTPINKTRVSAQASERSVEDQIAEERAHLHTNVQQAVPAKHEKSTVNMWKTARPSAAKVQEATAVAAGDWADADSLPEDRTTKKQPSAYNANANAVEQERASMQKSAQSAPASTTRTTTTNQKIDRPASAKEQTAVKALDDDWANADKGKLVARPAASKLGVSKAVDDKTQNVFEITTEPTATKQTVETVQAAKPAAKKVAAAAASLDSQKEPRNVDAGSVKKSSLRKRARH